MGLGRLAGYARGEQYVLSEAKNIGTGGNATQLAFLWCDVEHYWTGRRNGRRRSGWHADVVFIV